jgi:hypothetical protein
MTRRIYTVEFKKGVAQMMIIDGTPVQELSDQLGVGSLSRFGKVRQVATTK